MRAEQIGALVVSGMILELEKGFGGLIHISPQPMRQAAKVLENQSNDTAGHGQNTSNQEVEQVHKPLGSEHGIVVIYGAGPVTLRLWGLVSVKLLRASVSIASKRPSVVISVIPSPKPSTRERQGDFLEKAMNISAVSSA